MLDRNYKLVYRKNREAYTTLKITSIFNHVGGGVKEIYDDFINFRKSDLKQAGAKGIILTTKLHAEITDSKSSIYESIRPLNVSINEYIRSIDVPKAAKLGLDEILRDVHDDKKVGVLLEVLRTYRRNLDDEAQKRTEKASFEDIDSDVSVKVSSSAKQDTDNVTNPCRVWDVQKIYDGSQSPSGTEGSLFLGGFETGADVRYGLGKICIPQNNIKLVVTIMHENYLGDEQWRDIGEAFKKQGIRNIQVKDIIDYKVYPDNTTDIKADTDARREYIQKFVNLIKVMIPIINSHIQKGDNVLIHCIEGKSRSVSLVTAWLAKKLSLTRQEAFESVKKIRSIVDPNRDYLIAIDEYLRLPDVN